MVEYFTCMYPNIHDNVKCYIYVLHISASFYVYVFVPIQSPWQPRNVALITESSGKYCTYTCTCTYIHIHMWHLYDHINMTTDEGNNLSGLLNEFASNCGQDPLLQMLTKFCWIKIKHCFSSLH